MSTDDSVDSISEPTTQTVVGSLEGLQRNGVDVNNDCLAPHVKLGGMFSIAKQLVSSEEKLASTRKRL